MIYDRPGKGDNLAIEIGKDEMTYGHSIDSPTEVLTGENSNGEIIAIWIAEASGRKTSIEMPANAIAQILVMKERNHGDKMDSDLYTI